MHARDTNLTCIRCQRYEPRLYSRARCSYVERIYAYDPFSDSTDTLQLHATFKQSYHSKIEKQSLEEQIREFYARHAPERVSKAKEVARRYAKDEDVLNKALLSKYGSNLLSENESRLEERIREFYAKHALERVSRAKEVARRYVNDEDVLNEQLMSKYGSDLREVRLQNRDSVQEDR